MLPKLSWTNLQDIRKDIGLTMLEKKINIVANVPSKEILVPADTRPRIKHGCHFCIITKNRNEYNYS